MFATYDETETGYIAPEVDTRPDWKRDEDSLLMMVEALAATDRDSFTCWVDAHEEDIRAGKTCGECGRAPVVSSGCCGSCLAGMRTH